MPASRSNGQKGSSVKPRDQEPFKPKKMIRTALGAAYLADSAEFMSRRLRRESVDLIMTSPPYGLVRKKSYGNVDADDYVEWFKTFAKQFMRVLKPTGSLVIDIGGAWQSGLPVKSLYHYELLICLCKEFGFNLAQEFFWWNPSKLPTPAEWVNVRRIRVKDAVNNIFWLSKTPWPKASNRRVLQPYSDSMKHLLSNGYQPKLRPSGHDISDKFSIDNDASIPPNLLAVANTESNSNYLRYCREQGLPPNPARYPSTIPSYFIQMLTDPGDLVLDPFAGSCVTGEAAQMLKRRWKCIEIEEQFLEGAKGRFQKKSSTGLQKIDQQQVFYKIPKPGMLSEQLEATYLLEDGGKQRPSKPN